MFYKISCHFGCVSLGRVRAAAGPFRDAKTGECMLPSVTCGHFLVHDVLPTTSNYIRDRASRVHYPGSCRWVRTLGWSPHVKCLKRHGPGQLTQTDKQTDRLKSKGLVHPQRQGQGHHLQAQLVASMVGLARNPAYPSPLNPMLGQLVLPFYARESMPVLDPPSEQVIVGQSIVERVPCGPT